MANLVSSNSFRSEPAAATLREVVAPAFQRLRLNANLVDEHQVCNTRTQICPSGTRHEFYLVLLFLIAFRALQIVHVEPLVRT